MSEDGRQGEGLWHEEDGFFYDVLHTSEEHLIPLRVRSLVGLLPLFAVVVLEPDILDQMANFDRRLHWFVDNRPELTGNMASLDLPGVGQRRLLAILTPERLVRILQRLLDEDEFLSPYGIRSLSKHHQEHPYTFRLGAESYVVDYQPAESRTWLFGGNSNWRGPIWFPTNYLIVESLRTFHRYYGDELKVECPTGSGQMMTLAQVAEILSGRLQQIFKRDSAGQRPVYGRQGTFQDDIHWRDHLLFYEYFHADNGAGLGASHQTGWTALVSNLLQESARSRTLDRVRLRDQDRE
jgi:hypothetical protein